MMDDKHTEMAWKKIAELEAEVERLRASRDLSAHTVMVFQSRAEKAEAERSHLIAEAKHERSRADAAEAVYEQVTEALKRAYRKHHMGDDRIGWDELSDYMHSAICEAIGDDAYCEWSDRIRSELDAEGGE